MPPPHSRYRTPHIDLSTWPVVNPEVFFKGSGKRSYLVILLTFFLSCPRRLTPPGYWQFWVPVADPDVLLKGVMYSWNFFWSCSPKCDKIATVTINCLIIAYFKYLGGDDRPSRPPTYLSAMVYRRWLSKELSRCNCYSTAFPSLYFTSIASGFAFPISFCLLLVKLELMHCRFELLQFHNIVITVNLLISIFNYIFTSICEYLMLEGQKC